QDIYAMWKDSKHARAFENSIFAAAYRDVQRAGGDARRLCLRCHAPIAGITGDLDAQQAITREGETCDFCHSVTGVAIRDTDSPFVVEVGTTKRGPKVGSSSKAHGIQPSILHKSSRLCGGCHEFRNGEGVTTISTFAEWRASRYPAELRSCQDCHFLPVKGRASVQAAASPESKVPDHRLQRNEEQLRQAVRLDVQRVTRDADKLEVAVAIRNVGSGHAVPTGHPSRRLLLKVEARSAGNGTLLGEATRSYQKQLLDGGGRVLLRDSDLMQARSVQDTRIAAHENRTETFGFLVPAGEAVRVRVELEYLYRSHILAGNEWRVQVARHDSLIPVN
ncbi:MAG: multiheme c-type cytochrome, partial [candidate division NC10 bacterium]